MKSFLFNRRISAQDEEKFKELYGEEGDELASKLEGTTRYSLTSMPALSTAFINDVNLRLHCADALWIWK